MKGSTKSQVTLINVEFTRDEAGALANILMDDLVWDDYDREVIIILDELWNLLQEGNR